MDEDSDKLTHSQFQISNCCGGWGGAPWLATQWMRHRGRRWAPKVSPTSTGTVQSGVCLQRCTFGTDLPADGTVVLFGFPCRTGLRSPDSSSLLRLRSALGVLKGSGLGTGTVWRGWLWILGLFASEGDAKMARIAESGSLTVLLVIVIAVWLDGISRAVDAQQFDLIHKYAHLEGSSGRSAGKGASPDYFETLKAHDRRRLAAVMNIPLNGSFVTTSLYYTQISLGTPPRQYSVFVDTGSDVMWLYCAPCPSCPLHSDIKGFTLTQYDPKLSSTDKVLPCASPDCKIASDGRLPVCTDPVSPNACPYEILYVDGSGTNGYFLNDVMTFDLVVNGTNTVSTANVYFGCGHSQSGQLQSGSSVVDGLMGFGVGAITIPNQIANQKKTGRMFAHCLRGGDFGGGIIIMGNITEPDIVYTPLVPLQSHYNVGMQNIAVNGVNITTPASFDIKPLGRGGVVFDSGSSLALLIQPVHDQFVAAVAKNAPVPYQLVQNVFSNGGALPCFTYSGSIVGAFPEVKLSFDGGVVMNLGPSNYLYQIQFSTGETAYCIAWLPSSDFTIFGDIVLKDQLIVYDSDKQRIGWKPFDCTKSISVETGSSTVLPPAQAPTSPGGSSSAAQDSRTRMSTYLLSSCLAVAFLRTLL